MMSRMRFFAATLLSVVIAGCAGTTANAPSATPLATAASSATASTAAATAAATQATAATVGCTAPAAAIVELAGDFTDWQPVQLRRNAAGTWETVRKIPSGVYRFNVRIDGSGWFAPGGTARATDDFGGEVGIITVP